VTDCLAALTAEQRRVLDMVVEEGRSVREREKHALAFTGSCTAPLRPYLLVLAADRRNANSVAPSLCATD
jgi:hypothetical protein